MRTLTLATVAIALALMTASPRAADDRESELRAELAQDSTNTITLYNLACIVSLDNRPGEAMDLLERAILLGFTNYQHLLVDDSDLENCRQDPSFHDRMMAAINRRKASLEEEVKAKPYLAGQKNFQIAMICAALDDRKGVIDHMVAAFKGGYDDFIKVWNTPALNDCWSDTTFRAAHDAAYDKAYGWHGGSEEKMYGLMQLWATAKYNFAFFDQVPYLDWDAACRAAIPAVLATESLEDYYNLLMELATKLQDGHTGASQPWEISKVNDFLPIELALIDGRMYIERVGATEALAGVNLKPGMELVEVDGTPVMDWYDGAVVKRYCYGRPMGTFSIGQKYIFWGPKDEPVSLSWRDFDGATHTADIRRDLMLPDSSTFSFRTQTGAPYARFRFLDDGIVYCNLMSMQYNQLDSEFRAVFDTLDLSKVKGFILDVRENGGGNTGNGYAVISHFIDQPLEGSHWKTRDYRPSFAAWGEEEGWYDGGSTGGVQPADGPKYLGPLVVLTGPYTFSAAEDFVVPLDYSNRAVLVGDTTAGSTGQPLSIMLPGGGFFRVCTKKDTYPDGREFVGYGIPPDVCVTATVADLRNGRDAVLDKAVEVVRAWKKYHAAP